MNGNFKAGNAGFTTGYTLTTMTPYLFQDGVHGIYTVEKAGSIAGSSAYGDWTNISTAPSGKNANVFVADAATTAGTVVWSETVTVSPNTKYKFSFDAAEVSDPCCSNATLVPERERHHGPCSHHERFMAERWNDLEIRLGNDRDPHADRHEHFRALQ